MSDCDGKVIHYIQNELSRGREPSEEGYYIFARKELIEGSGISASAFNSCKDDVVKYFSSWCDLKRWAKYDEYAGEILYVDVSYERGKLKFKRNPITFSSELEHLWALPPLNDYFTYDSFDDKHRRRTNSNKVKFDAIPWSWDADVWEQIVQDGKDDIINSLVENPPDDSILIKQAKEIYAVFDVVAIQEGYQLRTLSKALYKAVGAMLPELCSFFIENGADPNEIVQQGYSSVVGICGSEKKGEDWEKVVKILIDAGADLTWGHFNTYSFAGEVFSKGSDDLCRYYIDALYKQGILSLVSITNNTPFSAALVYKKENSEVVKYLKSLL